MSDSEGYSDLWKFDDEDGNVVLEVTTPISPNQNQSSVLSKRKRMESDNVLTMLCKKSKRRKHYKKFQGKFDDSEEDEISNQPENKGNRRFSMKGLQKASPIKMSLLDDDDDDDCAEGNIQNDQKSGDQAKSKNPPKSQQKNDKIVVKGSEQMMKIREDLNEMLQSINDTSQQDEGKIQDGTICVDEVCLVQPDNNVVQICDDDEIQILEDDGQKQVVVENKEEKQKEIYLQIDVECSHGKIPIKIYPSQNLSEAFSKFLEEATQRGWICKGKKFQFTYLGNKIDEWQTASDVGLLNKSSIQATIKEDVVEQINLQIKCQSGDVLSFKHGPSDEFEKLFQKYRETALSKKWITSKTKLVFQFDGEKLEGDEKPQDHDMEDQDQIDVTFKN
eukprot:TRINITY_DN4879_c1_g2_i1.p1 TRINITY_DN4879_c1_g2~~TRINITY_DN4879_c1_g2_i1.p1  ORF type:complete len:409 (-),score=64.42 TRINITY_DN4879_c1_g2_i1:265-1434(-)